MLFRSERIADDTDRENVAADKLKVEVFSKAAARLNPRFQDKQVVENKDEYGQMTPEQVRDRIRRMVEANPELASLLPASLSMNPVVEEIDLLPVEPDFPSLSHGETDTLDVDAD